MTDTVFALGIGTGTRNARGEWLDVFYPAPLIHLDRSAFGATLAAVDPGVTELDADALHALEQALTQDGQRAQADLCAQLAGTVGAIVTRLDQDEPLDHPAAAYLKLTLLSQRQVRPNEMNLQGLFGALHNVAWTSEGPVDPEELDALRLQRRLEGRHLEVYAIDKFPRMINYVTPSGVRIADGSRVRLGAHLASGTTVMHEGQVNFNAGTLGHSMVEGRISQGVTLGDGTDLGGGASTMGTLSGGGEMIVSIGAQCLIGANGGTGLPLGDRCKIEAGLYVTAGTRVAVIDEDGQEVRTVKARELAGIDDALFLRNSVNGRVECRTNRRAIQLNADLHAND